MVQSAQASTASPAWLARLRAWLASDMRTLRWVFGGLYALLLLALLTSSLFVGPAFIIMAGVMLAAQALFIFGAGTVELCRPIRRRRLALPVIVASLMFTLLVMGLFVALSELFEIDTTLREDLFVFIFWSLIPLSWVGWGLLLWIYAKDWNRMRVLSRLSTMLFAGSLLELLATVPSHMIVIRRPGCLVGIGTAMGIIAGLNVMFFSFGPMIAVLFLRPRYRREQAMGSQFCEVCGYDLRASPVRCPECGTPRRQPLADPATWPLPGSTGPAAQA